MEKHSINDENIDSLGPITQEAGTWRVPHAGDEYAVTVVRYFRRGGAVEYGGSYTKRDMPNPRRGTSASFFPDEAGALNHLLALVRAVR